MDLKRVNFQEIGLCGAVLKTFEVKGCFCLPKNNLGAPLFILMVYHLNCNFMINDRVQGVVLLSR